MFGHRTSIWWPSSFNTVGIWVFPGAEKEANLLRFTAADGQQRGASVSLKAPPVFDGMSVAEQALFISLINGSLVCLK
jgi:hypothetical protein